VVRYIKVDDVCNMMIMHGASIEKITYHHMPCHKRFLNQFKPDKPEPLRLKEMLIEWEFRISEHLQGFNQIEKEKLFPSICIWARKR